MFRILRAGLPPATLLLLAGCLSIGRDANSQRLDFNFRDSTIAAGWAVEAADFPTTRLADVGLVGDWRPLPSEVSTTLSGLYMSGTNVTGDLFVFLKKRLTGLPAGQRYSIAIQLEYVSNVHSGCTSGLATSVWIKAGVSALAPIAFDDGGVYHLTLDKGIQSAAGSYTQLGNIRNGLSGCPSTGSFAVRLTNRQDQSATLTTDSEGGFWIFLGTQSAVLARHELYITALQVTLFPLF
ncbi:MAG TPA: hypothetical protein VGQ17_07735 [Gemmatimonadales bacterium]|nr:hypothetical protein [Gemmatimonadales bacterium]